MPTCSEGKYRFAISGCSHIHWVLRINLLFWHATSDITKDQHQLGRMLIHGQQVESQTNVQQHLI